MTLTRSYADSMTDVRTPLYIDQSLYERIAAAAAASGQDADAFARRALSRELLRWALDHPGRIDLNDDVLQQVQVEVDTLAAPADLPSPCELSSIPASSCPH